MVDAIKSLIQWIVDQLIAMLVGIYNFFLAIFQAWFDFFFALFNAGWTFVKNQIDALWDDIWDVILGYWDALVLFGGNTFSMLWDWLKQVGLDYGIDIPGLIAEFEGSGQTLANIYEGAAWLFPINESLAIMAAAYTACAGIRLARWAIGFVPWTFGS